MTDISSREFHLDSTWRSFGRSLAAGTGALTALISMLAGVPLITSCLRGALAFFGSLLLWGEGFVFSFPEHVDLSYPITDILVNAPASIIAAIGIWRMKRYGFVAAQFVAGFYIYASVKIFVAMFQEGPPYLFGIFGPQILAVVIAVALVVYLWGIRSKFGWGD